MDTAVRLERYESADKEILEKRRQSRESRRRTVSIEPPQLIRLVSTALYLSLLAHREALDRLREQAKKTEEDLDTLKGILKELSENYNPNYQDMAVKAAVVGFTENFVRGEGSPDEEEGARGELQSTLEELQKTDLTGLLMAGDGDMAESSDDSAEDSTRE
jgi:protein kinase C substrate 80K-H